MNVKNNDGDGDVDAGGPSKWPIILYCEDWYCLLLFYAFCALFYLATQLFTISAHHVFHSIFLTGFLPHSNKAINVQQSATPPLKIQVISMAMPTQQQILIIPEISLRVAVQQLVVPMKRYALIWTNRTTTSSPAIQVIQLCLPSILFCFFCVFLSSLYIPSRIFGKLRDVF